MESVSNAELKETLTRWGVDHSHVVERAELVALFNAKKLERNQNKLQAEPQQQTSSMPQQQPSTRTQQQQRQQQQQRSEEGWNWQTVLGTLLLAYLFFGNALTTVFQGPEEGLSAFSEENESYLQGQIIALSTMSDYERLLQLQREHTGLPVAMLFSSPSCGPCRAIAPVYKQLAEEYKGKAVFTKVDMSQGSEIAGYCQVRSMPTFHFYYGESMLPVAKFSGADTRQLKGVLVNLAAKAEAAGTFAGVEVTQVNLEDFLNQHGDKDPASTARDMLSQHSKKMLLLMRTLQAQYGGLPMVTEKKVITPASATGIGDESLPPLSDKDAQLLAGIPLEALQQELLRRGDQPVVDMWHGFADGIPSIPETLVIIGGGPAGLSAALYAARGGLKPLVIAPFLGGQLMEKGVGVENFPGISGPAVSGSHIVTHMRSQAVSFGARLYEDSVVSVDLSSYPFTLRLNATEGQLKAHAIILATGARTRWLGVPGEDRYRGQGVSACATCDGFLHRGKVVAIMGGGDAAVEDALTLSRIAKEVHLVHRGETFRASKILSDRLGDHSNIHLHLSSKVVEFAGGNEILEEVVLKDAKGKISTLKVDAAFVAIGQEPNTEMFRPALETDSAGYLSTQSGSTLTSIDGVFAAGDVMDSVYRQAVTSAATGTMAALDAERWFAKRKSV